MKYILLIHCEINMGSVKNGHLRSFGLSLPIQNKEDLNKFLDGQGMNPWAFLEKSKKSTKSEIFKNALELNPLMLHR